MILEYLTTPGLRIASSAQTSFAKIPSRIARKDYTPERRLADLTPILAQINTPNFLRRARAEAVLGKPMMRALAFGGTATSISLDHALNQIGLRAIDAEEEPVKGMDGALMSVPLTLSQKDQCEMAWLLLRLGTDPKAAQRIRSLADNGLSWLLTPYLEAFGEYDLQLSLTAADVLDQMSGQAEIAQAYRLRTFILDGQLARAKTAIQTAEQQFPDAGWLEQMKLWYANAISRSGS